MRIALAALALSLFPHLAIAQSVVGTTVVDGKRVELLSDNSWRFADGSASADANCQWLDDQLSTCARWRTSSTEGSDYLIVYRIDSRNYAGVIHDELGENDGIDSSFLKNLALENAARVIGTQPENIPVLELTNTSVDGIPTETLVYQIELNGVDFVYHNTILASPDHSFQFMNWSINDEITPKQIEIREEFLGNMRITLPEATE